MCEWGRSRRKTPTSVGGKSLFLPSYVAPACRMSPSYDSWSAVKSAQTLPDWEIKVKTKKTLLQALKMLKTPCFLVTDNHVCVYVSPNAATSLVSSSGEHCSFCMKQPWLFTHRPPDSVSRPLEFAHQGQRCCSNHQGTIMKRTKGGTVMSEIHQANAGVRSAALLLA